MTQWAPPLSTLNDVNGNALAFVYSASGFQLQTAPTPTIMFCDNFDGPTIDTVNRWAAPVVAGSGTMTQAGGNLVATCGTTAGNGAALTTLETFQPTYGNLSCGGLLITEAVPSINTNRCLGYYTRPGSWTAATPVQDGYVWELDITGAFGCSIYNSGVRIFRATQGPSGPFTLSPYTLVAIGYQGLNVYFYYGSLLAPAITVPVAEPAVIGLPGGFHCINHTAGPALAPTWSIPGIAFVDGSGISKTVFNGQTYSRQRFPGKFVNINALSVAAEVAIWTPAAGRRFRLLGYQLSGTAAGNLVLKDNTAGATILVLPAAPAGSVLTSPPMGNGILSGAVNNVLTANAGAADSLSGYVYGCEE